MDLRVETTLMKEKKALFCVGGIFSVSHLLAIEIIERSSPDNVAI